MQFNDGCSKRQLAALVIVTSWLTGCATVGSESGGSAVCPPVVAYSRAEQQRAAGEIASLPRDAVIIGWLVDYSVMREQARGCAAKFTSRIGNGKSGRSAKLEAPHASTAHRASGPSFPVYTVKERRANLPKPP